MKAQSVNLGMNDSSSTEITQQSQRSMSTTYSGRPVSGLFLAILVVAAVVTMLPGAAQAGIIVSATPNRPQVFEGTMQEFTFTITNLNPNHSVYIFGTIVDQPNDFGMGGEFNGEPITRDTNNPCVGTLAPAG